MLIPTSRATAEDIIKADLERVEQARWAALCELYSELDKVHGYLSFRRWCRRVNKRAAEIFLRLQ